MDSFLEKVIGVRWNAHLATDGAQIRDLSEISFDALRVVTSRGEVLGAFKKWRIRVLPVFFWGSTAEIDADSLTLQSYFFKRFPDFFSPISHLTKKTLFIHPVRFIARKHGAKLTLHLLEFRSSVLRLRGGFLLNRGVLTKAHLLLYLSAKPNTRLLKDFFARMTLQKNGSRKARFILANKTLTIFGKTGPLFRADWV